ncbi:hypothetical protein [Kitasatospora cineracea]|uniref:hypothetical protein n=1 Tax=Kitasatospora cineracea TaxID=88074 RepID=UPI00369A88CB
MSPTCWRPGCPAPLVAQWQRRPTQAELDDQAAAALAARTAALAAAGLDPAAAAAIPAPTPSTSTRAVHACADHAITMDLAQHVHQDTCTAPGSALPSCSCTPEPLPVPPSAPPTTTLPTGWVVPAT